MKIRGWGLRGGFWILGMAVVLLPALVMYASRHADEREGASSQRKSPAGEALGLTTLGVAHLNQGKAAEGQKSREQVWESHPEFAVATLKLGIPRPQEPRTARRCP